MGRASRETWSRRFAFMRRMGEREHNGKFFTKAEWRVWHARWISKSIEQRIAEAAAVAEEAKVAARKGAAR